jgi:hypothetical protein
VGGVVGWIVVSVLVLAVGVFVGAVVALMERTRPLVRALRRLRSRAEQASALREGAGEVPGWRART